MKDVNDRIVQYPNRYKLTNINNNEVLGTFDFDEVTGTVHQVGTEINAELFESIKTDLSSLFTNTTNLKNDSFASVEESGNTVTFKNKDGIVLGEFTIEQVHYDDATQNKSGLMSGQDKLKLDGIENGAQVNTVEPTGTYSGMTVGNATNAESADKVDHALTISTDTETKTYDGSAEVSITIPQATEVKTSTEWESQNPVLGAGKFGYDSTNKITKIGDGVTAWNVLKYFSTTFGQVSFSEATPEHIEAIASAGLASEAFNVGDEKNIELTTGEVITVVILGFDHDDLADGSGKAPISIGMKNLLATTYRMNATDTNVGGWNESEMRTSTMNTLFNLLPSSWKNIIKTVNKKAAAGNQSTSIITSADKLWLFATSEIDSRKVNETDIDEGEQYEYWKTIKDGNVNSNRIKYLSNGSGSANGWWSRTSNISNSVYMGNFMSDGNMSWSFPSGVSGVSFGFCV